MALDSLLVDSHPSVRWLILASLVTLTLSFIPFAWVITYPFLLFSTLIHEACHAVVALLTGGRAESLIVRWNGSGMTLTRGGIQALISSAGYIGTAVFGGLMLVLSRDSRMVRPALAGCALLSAGITAEFIGRTNNLLVLALLSFIVASVAASIRKGEVSSRVRMLAVAGILLTLLLVYLLWTRSLFSWAVGLFTTLGLAAVLRFASMPVAHFFLSFLAVQCSLNALQAVFVLYSLSVRASCRTDAQTMASVTGFPALFWAIAWAMMAVAILAFCLWLYAQPRFRTSK